MSEHTPSSAIAAVIEPRTVMDFSRKGIRLGAIGAGSFAIAFSIWSWVQIQRLSLPYPVEIPISNACIPVVILGLNVLLKKYLPTIQTRLPPALLALIVYCATILPTLLLTWSAVYIIPSDLLACSSEMSWARKFRRKDEAAIRSIQDRLHCCGFNSMHDRAWPFPSRDNDARTCERTQGYLISCAETWQKKALEAAIVGGVASFFNALVLILLAAAAFRQPLSRDSYAPIQEPDVRSRLLQSRDNDEAREDMLPDVSDTLREEETRSALRGH